MTILASALAHWREILIGAAIVGLFAMCSARDAAIADKARAEVLYHQADSVVKANAPKLARVDTLIVRDTVQVRRTIARLDTLRDTLLRHVTDTLLVKEFVTRADSAAHACTELANDCAAFRTFATQRFAADSIKLHTQPTTIAKPGRVRTIGADLLWAAVGYGLHAIVRRP